jgi:hypothetical protein
MSRITRTAELRSCTVRLLGCTNERETVVFAHAPSTEKGLGRKSPDWWGAFSCHHCHDILDGRKGSLMNSGQVWNRAIFETQKQLFDEGFLLVG